MLHRLRNALGTCSLLLERKIFFSCSLSLLLFFFLCARSAFRWRTLFGRGRNGLKQTTADHFSVRDPPLPFFEIFLPRDFHAFSPLYDLASDSSGAFCFLTASTISRLFKRRSRPLRIPRTVFFFFCFPCLSLSVWLPPFSAGHHPLFFFSLTHSTWPISAGPETLPPSFFFFLF